jgi:transcriptional regulator with XRE-family HTH domain
MVNITKIRELMRVKRKEKKMSQQELADKLGVRSTTVSNYEKGVSDPSFEMLDKISNILEINLATLDHGGSFSEPGMPYYNKSIKYFDVDVSAGSLAMFDDNYDKGKDMHLPGFEDCDVALSVYGDSMYPAYQSGDIIVCKEIGDKSMFVYGEAYLVITKEYRLVKYVKKSKYNNKLLLVSENDLFEDIDVNVDDILKLFLVKGKIRRNTI